MPLTVRDVQNCQGAGSGAPTSTLAMTAFASNPVAGDCIVVAQSHYNSASASLSPTDSMGSTYTQIGTTVKQSAWNANTGMSLWMAANVAGGSSVVVTARHVNNNHCAVAWCLTSPATSPYNSDWKENHGGGTTNPVSGASVGTPTANSLMLACLFEDDSVAASVGAGWNTTGVNGYTAGMDARCQVAFSGIPIRMCTAYKMVSASDSMTWTVVIPHAYVSMIASFAPSAGGGTSSNAMFFGA